MQRKDNLQSPGEADRGIIPRIASTVSTHLIAFLKGRLSSRSRDTPQRSSKTMLIVDAAVVSATETLEALLKCCEVSTSEPTCLPIHVCTRLRL